jgi:poly(A) polymerase
VRERLNVHTSASDDIGSFRRFLGVTPPIATSESNEREKEVTDTLMSELRRQNTFEGAEEARKR